MIKKTLIPSDPRVFKHRLLRTKVAKRTIRYNDGTERVEIWNAEKFDATSNLMNNISSQLWHRRDKAYIVEAIYEIMDYDDSDDFQDLDIDLSLPFYISYNLGWDSFRSTGEYVVGYVINNGWISIAYNNGFVSGRCERKKLSPNQMRELALVLDLAYRMGAFERSDTTVNSHHGPLHTYEYGYRGLVGRNCGTLFTDSALMARYLDTVNKILK